MISTEHSDEVFGVGLIEVISVNLGSIHPPWRLLVPCFFGSIQSRFEVKILQEMIWQRDCEREFARSLCSICFL